LLADKASTHETLGTLKGELMSANVQLEAMRAAVKEHESDKARETEKTNVLYADLARVSAEREGANEQLAAAREEAASARAASAEASVLVAETKARALRLEDAAEHAASDLARAKSERDGVEKRLDETAAELARVSTSLAAAEARAEAAARDAATANAANAKEAFAFARCAGEREGEKRRAGAARRDPQR
jgi:chromosome segregation ATPase